MFFPSSLALHSLLQQQILPPQGPANVFYYMWTNVVGPQLNPVLSKLNVKTAADVDELLDCEVRM